MGSAITDPILRTTDGSDYKGVDEYDLANITAAVLQVINCPRSGDVLTKLADVINYRFNFQQKFSPTLNQCGHKLPACNPTSL